LFGAIIKEKAMSLYENQMKDAKQMSLAASCGCFIHFCHAFLSLKMTAEPAAGDHITATELYLISPPHKHLHGMQRDSFTYNKSNRT
jgi:hypothetical protein